MWPTLSSFTHSTPTPNSLVPTPLAAHLPLTLNFISLSQTHSLTDLFTHITQRQRHKTHLKDSNPKSPPIAPLFPPYDTPFSPPCGAPPLPPYGALYFVTTLITEHTTAPLAPITEDATTAVGSLEYCRRAPLYISTATSAIFFSTIYLLVFFFILIICSSKLELDLVSHIRSQSLNGSNLNLIFYVSIFVGLLFILCVSMGRYQ